MRQGRLPSAQDRLVDRIMRMASQPVCQADALRLTRLVADTFAIAHYARGKGIGAAAKLAAGAGPLPVWGGGGVKEPTEAAFQNGVAAEALDYQEVLIDGRNNGHAAVVIVPALSALAGASPAGRVRLLPALRAAFVANVVLARALGRAHRTGGPGFRTTSLTAPIAAALGGAVLVGGDAALATGAVGVAAASLPAGLLSAMSPEAGDFSDDKDVSVGLSARHAVECVNLVGAGVRGPRDALAGPRGWLASYGFGDEDAGALDSEPEAIDLAAYAVKLYPANFGCQCAIRLAIELAREVPYEAIAAITCRVKSSSAASLAARSLGSHIAARFSLPYAVASAFIRGRSALGDFEDDAFADPTVLDLMSRVALEPSEAFESRHRKDGTFPAELIVTTRAGRIVSRQLDDPWAGFSEAEAEAAFSGKLHALLPTDVAATLVALLEDRSVEAVLSLILSTPAPPEVRT